MAKIGVETGSETLLTGGIGEGVDVLTFLSCKKEAAGTVVGFCVAFTNRLGLSGWDVAM